MVSSEPAKVHLTQLESDLLQPVGGSAEEVQIPAPAPAKTLTDLLCESFTDEPHNWKVDEYGIYNHKTNGTRIYRSGSYVTLFDDMDLSFTTEESKRIVNAIKKTDAYLAQIQEEQRQKKAEKSLKKAMARFGY